MATRAGERPKAATAARSTPRRSQDFDHLTLDGLRAYRRALTAEENKVSYWRRLIQARLDMLASGERPGVEDKAFERLRGVLAESRGTGRQALVAVGPIDEAPPLPDLEALWSQQLRPGDDEYTHTLRKELSFAELQLSAYRTALHRRLTSSTQELIARYHEDPALALSALPLPREESRGA